MKNFKVGDHVEAIRDHSNLNFRKGDRFIVYGTKAITCKGCGKIVHCLTIGFPITPGYQFVQMFHTPSYISPDGCGKPMGIFTKNWYHYANFKHVGSEQDNDKTEEQFKPISYTKILEKVQLSES